MSGKTNAKPKGRFSRACDALRAAYRAYERRAVCGGEMDQFVYLWFPVSTFYFAAFVVADFLF
jgi:hypothetical protein